MYETYYLPVAGLFYKQYCIYSESQMQHISFVHRKLRFHKLCFMNRNNYYIFLNNLTSIYNRIAYNLYCLYAQFTIDYIFFGTDWKDLIIKSIPKHVDNWIRTLMLHISMTVSDFHLLIFETILVTRKCC